MKPHTSSGVHCQRWQPLIAIIMGGIVGGIFTATEAAGVAALYTWCWDCFTAASR